MFCRKFLFLLLASALVAAGCSSPLRIAGRPFIVSDVPPDFPRLPLRIAVVRTGAMQAFPTRLAEKELLGQKLAESALQGMVEAARLIAVQADLLDAPPAAGYDLILTPANPYFDLQSDSEGLHVTLSLDVAVRDPARQKERGLLLSGEGRPGRRRTAPVELQPRDGGPAKIAGVMSAPIHASPIEEALNNALFYLALDCAEKLYKRGQQIIQDRRDGQ
jgi:hypothetical protein